MLVVTGCKQVVRRGVFGWILTYWRLRMATFGGQNKTERLPLSPARSEFKAKTHTTDKHESHNNIDASDNEVLSPRVWLFIYQFDLKTEDKR